MAHLTAASFLPTLLLPPRPLIRPSTTGCLVTAYTAGLSCYFGFHEFMCHFPNSVPHASRTGIELHAFHSPGGYGRLSTIH